MNKGLALITILLFAVEEFRIDRFNSALQEEEIRKEFAYNLAVHYREQYIKANGNVQRANRAMKSALYIRQEPK